MRKISVYSNILVVIQLIGMILVLVPWNGIPSIQWLPGLAVLAAGMLMVLWVIRYNRPGNFSIFPEPLDHAELITSGPYRYLRHPMYTSLLLIMAGFSLVNLHLANLLGFILVLLAVLQKIPREERFLSTQFRDYAKFCEGRYRLIPFIW